MKNRVLIRRIIVIAIAVCVVLALVLPLFVKADIAIGGDVNYQEVDYYVMADGSGDGILLYYGPGIEYGSAEKIDNGEILHIIETCDNIYDQLQWGLVESDGPNRWVRLEQTTTEEIQTTTEGTLVKNIFTKIVQFLEAVMEFFRSLR